MTVTRNGSPLACSGGGGEARDRHGRSQLVVARGQGRAGGRHGRGDACQQMYLRTPCALIGLEQLDAALRGEVPLRSVGERAQRDDGTRVGEPVGDIELVVGDVRAQPIRRREPQLRAVSHDR